MEQPEDQWNGIFPRSRAATRGWLVAFVVMLVLFIAAVNGSVTALAWYLVLGSLFWPAFIITLIVTAYRRSGHASVQQG